MKEHIKNVEIDNEIIQVKYYEFNNEENLYDNLFDESFNLWDKITILFYRIKNKIRDTYWKIRYGFQRMFKDYDNADMLCTYDKFVERYTKILTEYRKTHIGYVCSMTNEEWETIIDEMIYHLHYMDEETVTKELEKDVSDDWSVSLDIVYQIMEKHKNEFFELFSQYFYSLWN